MTKLQTEQVRDILIRLKCGDKCPDCDNIFKPCQKRLGINHALSALLSKQLTLEEITEAITGLMGIEERRRIAYLVKEMMEKKGEQ